MDVDERWGFLVGPFLDAGPIEPVFDALVWFLLLLVQQTLAISEIKTNVAAWQCYKKVKIPPKNVVTSATSKPSLDKQAMIAKAKKMQCHVVFS